MKIIFLDIDGVLNSLTTPEQELIDPDLYPNCIEVLNSIIEKTNAEVVISSDWRINFQPTCQRLYRAGFKGNIIGHTKCDWSSIYGNVKRGEEVAEWLRKNGPVESYLILDDRTDFLDTQTSHFLHIDPMYGLTPNHIDRAINILQ